jgi:hypothetical protein
MQDHDDTNEEESLPTIEELKMAVKKLKKIQSPRIR